MKSLMTALLVTGATLAADAGMAAVVYNVNRSSPCFIGCTGNVTVTGTITVNSLGSLTAANFTDWNLVFTSTPGGTNVLTPSNSAVGGNPANVQCNRSLNKQGGKRFPPDFWENMADRVNRPVFRDTDRS